MIMDNIGIVLEVIVRTVENLSAILHYFFVGTAGYIDRVVFGPYHLLDKPTCQ